MTNTKTTRIQVYTREQFALIKGVSAECIIKWQASGKVHPIKVGGKVFYTEDGSLIDLNGKNVSITRYLEIN